MIFVESPVFTADVKELLSDEGYAALQEHLALRPDAGDLITQTGRFAEGAVDFPGQG